MVVKIQEIVSERECAILNKSYMKRTNINKSPGLKAQIVTQYEISDSNPTILKKNLFCPENERNVCKYTNTICEQYS